MEPFTQTPLQQLYGVGDVTGIGLGQQTYQNSVDQGTLKNQFDAQQNPQLIQKLSLDNIFNEQNNPLKVQNSQLTNAGLVDSNRLGAVKANCGGMVKFKK